MLNTFLSLSNHGKGLRAFLRGIARFWQGWPGRVSESLYPLLRLEMLEERCVLSGVPAPMLNPIIGNDVWKEQALVRTLPPEISFSLPAQGGVDASYVATPPAAVQGR